MNEKARSRAAWCAALIILCGALVFFNMPDAAKGGDALPPAAPENHESDAPFGHEPGERLPDFTLTKTDGGAFTLSAQRGKVAVINLWATWCTPCVNELPYFEKLRQAHGGDVSILAIHSDLITDDVQAYLANYDYGMDFAVDETGDVVALLGGSTMLPQTVVLDPYGVVTYNKVGSVTYEALEELYQAALAGERGKADNQ
ncbi:MAG: TlpA family protein disulfide reductase [Clostridia bacterium]|nr:TlpA family protein disulfide reductase [Clostridia bacterium]